MRAIRAYFTGFLNRSGDYVFIATIVSRILSFLSSWLALQLIEEQELGIILFAYSIIQFIIPISGMGLHQSLIRYGALLESEKEKNQLFNYVLKKGIISSLLLIIGLVTTGFFIPFQFEGTYFFFSILSFSILSFFLLEVVKVKFRLQHKNKLFALSEFTHSFILLLLIGILSYYFQGNGYVAALVIAPLLAAALFVSKLEVNFKFSKRHKVVDLKFWRYGFFGGLSNVVTQLLFLIDMILIGYLLDDASAVTKYRYVSLLPFSLLFLPRVFISTDFVAFTEKIRDRNYIENYIKNYMLFFGFASILIVLAFILAGKFLLGFFGDNYPEFYDSFVILTFGISGIFILRGLFGNLLSSIGKIEWNYVILSLAVTINIISNYILIPTYGIKGAAITSCALMWISGILSWLTFKYFYSKFE